MSKAKGSRGRLPLRKRPRQSTPRHLQYTTPAPSVVSAWEQLPISLTVRELAAVIRCSENSVYEMLKRGDLKGLGVRCGNQHRFSRDRVRAFLEGET